MKLFAAIEHEIEIDSVESVQNLQKILSDKGVKDNKFLALVSRAEFNYMLRALLESGVQQLRVAENPLKSVCVAIDYCGLKTGDVEIHAYREEEEILEMHNKMYNIKN